MKILIASDIHGSAKAAKQVLQQMQQEGAERLVLLGDLLYHGPRNNEPEAYDTKAVAALLNQCADKPFCVRGNCDAEVDQMVLDFPMMADYALLMLPKGRTAFLTHGHLFHQQQLPPHRKGDLLIHGHTHVHGIWKLDDCAYCNPGSAALPKENQVPTYMILEDACVLIKDLYTGEVLQSGLFDEIAPM